MRILVLLVVLCFVGCTATDRGEDYQALEAEMAAKERLRQLELEQIRAGAKFIPD